KRPDADVTDLAGPSTTHWPTLRPEAGARPVLHQARNLAQDAAADRIAPRCTAAPPLRPGRAPLPRARHAIHRALRGCARRVSAAFAPNFAPRPAAARRGW